VKDIPIPLEKERSPFLRSVREVIRTRRLAYKTEKTYLVWIEVVIPFLAEAIAYFGFNLFQDYFLNKNLQNQCGALILVSCPAPQFSCRALTEKCDLSTQSFIMRQSRQRRLFDDGS
jgi:hypothetical protein